MITDSLLTILMFAIDGIILLFSALGEIPDNSAIITGIQTIGSYLSPLNNILPLGTIFAILAFEVIFETSYLVYKFIRWGYQKIPFIN